MCVCVQQKEDKSARFIDVALKNILDGNDATYIYIYINRYIHRIGTPVKSVHSRNPPSYTPKYKIRREPPPLSPQPAVTTTTKKTYVSFRTHTIYYYTDELLLVRVRRRYNNNNDITIYRTVNAETFSAHGRSSAKSVGGPVAATVVDHRSRRGYVPPTRYYIPSFLFLGIIFWPGISVRSRGERLRQTR